MADDAPEPRGGGGAAAPWRRFLAPYYLSALLLSAPAYMAMRVWFVAQGGTPYSRIPADGLWEKERFTLGLLAASLALKYFKRDSLDAFLSDAGTYCKCAALLMAWFMDVRLAAYYALAALLAYLLFPQPIYRGPSAVLPLSPATFRELVEAAPPGAPSWLVQFWAPWAPACIHLEPAVAELSLRYGGDASRLRFGRVDAARWPALAEAHKVQAYGSVPSLPTFVLFEGGREVGRIPHLFEDGSVSNIRIRRQDVVTAFGLDDFLQPAVAAAAGRRPAAGAGAAKGRGAKKQR